MPMIFSSWSQEATKRWMMRKIWSCRKLCYRFITLDLLVKAHRNPKNTRKLPDSWNKEITEQASFSSLYSNLSFQPKAGVHQFLTGGCVWANWATSGVSGCMSLFIDWRSLRLFWTRITLLRKELLAFNWNVINLWTMDKTSSLSFLSNPIFGKQVPINHVSWR